ncbi:MAG: aminomethyl-transferring glycine dehydrogenase subunit GcvPB [Desulfobacula sp.]|jgi:glycine dehydrogenase subunit 2|uniref:aminomethyl-transferring glycine dehydrogenase subunit GcvPB n=1 Tax=Desulfobacula sp. TaxID=2593537 RepID=UPI001D963550|nr:aminomethyl-transferring glycine dehydrogenase subunit GcvPB [Desulfobacula sp.]MBT3484676.1 aminomethyl-transferring glycine dehydrogenase subunit GcvPB [Desulfobacula sp.]MBT3806746.1 aminomethyl-transferring glycine dehydrogenase subunit GcvPB [Desulfobacula sp.]MBT4027255.1 aminomethyl-transferring glycine dehydrogenase subunit GcvPB [Desulfobacula sp.]MBT4508813.1 aminomethyl-transferring glycine dehydrogenase subunit GcvPB [Desulfobacula sp.]
MNKQPGTSGLIFNEPLLWDKSREGRCAVSLPKPDVERADLEKDLIGDAPELPQLSELDVVRHYTRLSQWNFGVDSGMYPLGSCTMKYNPKTNEVQAARQGFAGAHPFAGEEFSQGALKLMYNLEQYLAKLTGFDAVTLQPAAGAHGELAGMLMIHAYHAKMGKQRSKIIIPDTAHGTNPASASLCGYDSINIKSGDNGILEPLAVAAVMDEETAGIMVTNPNTLGLFESNIKEIADIVHSKGGLVYGDGANMNAIMGIVKPGEIGVDVLHFNLHKTFSTPHGGGGPGSGPVAVGKTLEPFLPVPRIVKELDSYKLVTDFSDTMGRLHTFYGHFGVMIRAYAYILSMGGKGLTDASKLAVLNANYVKESLKGTLNLPYDYPCMHECVFNDEFQKEYHITTMDMAKRLLDYGFHPPTVYFPLVVDSAFMVEPTETESKEDIDQFISAVKAIAKEAQENPEKLKKAPHKTKVTRLDEVAAARKPCLRG